MWFVSEQHSAELGELGRLEGVAGAEELKALAAALQADKQLSFQDKWDSMRAKICVKPR